MTSRKDRTIDAGDDHGTRKVLCEHAYEAYMGETKLRPCCEYRCTKCDAHWRGFPRQVQCSCGCPYIEWVNYEAWRKTHPLD